MAAGGLAPPTGPVAMSGSRSGGRRSARRALRHRAFGLQDRPGARQGVAECDEPVWSGKDASQHFEALLRLAIGLVSGRAGLGGCRDRRWCRWRHPHRDKSGFSSRVPCRLGGRAAWVEGAGLLARSGAGMERCDLVGPIARRLSSHRPWRIGVASRSAGRRVARGRRARQSRSGAAGWALSDFRAVMAGAAGSASAAVIPGRVCGSADRPVLTRLAVVLFVLIVQRPRRRHPCRHHGRSRRLPCVVWGVLFWVWFQQGV